MFYLVCKSLTERDELLKFLKNNGVWAVFHYLSLEESPFYSEYHDGRILTNSHHFSNTLLRLPFFYELEEETITYITQLIIKFFNSND